MRKENRKNVKSTFFVLDRCPLMQKLLEVGI